MSKKESYDVDIFLLSSQKARLLSVNDMTPRRLSHQKTPSHQSLEKDANFNVQLDLHGSISS